MTEKKIFMTAKQASDQLKQLGYEGVPIEKLGDSHYIDTLITIAASKTPMDFSEVLDAATRSLRGKRD